MKTKFILITMLLCIFSSFAEAQKDVKARELLDKTAAIIDSEKGVEIKFDIASIVNKQQQNKIQGCISIKKNKFFLQLPSSKTWFDGKTQWTYLPENEEVNLSTPTPEELQSINPYSFIYLYKNGYNYQYAGSKKYNGKNVLEIKLKAQSPNNTIQTVILYVNNYNYQPIYIKMEDKNKNCNTINVLSIKKDINLRDNQFVFNKAQYPNAEIIDLR